MTAFVELQNAELASQEHGFTAVRHQRKVGAGYFDGVATAINPDSETEALSGSTEEQQFEGKD